MRFSRTCSIAFKGSAAPTLCLLLVTTVAPLRAATVTLDPSTEYQTIRGWGASSWNPSWVRPAALDEVIREAVDDLGLTRLRLEPPSGNRNSMRRWEWLNDNDDPEAINWSAFDTTALDERAVNMVVPFKQRVEANGDPFDIYLSPSFFNGGSSGEVPPWLRYNPGEYAEFALAWLLRMRDVHGVEADYYCICNEAGNNNPFNASLVADLIKTLGPRLQAHGLRTTIQFPECVNAQTSWNYIQSTQADDEMWSYVGAVSYHLYGTNDPYRSQIRDFAVAKGLPTGQTEYMGLNMNHLYDDLLLGGVSYWEIYGIGSQFEWRYNSFGRKSQYWNFRQVLHYVRPGAVRIEASSDDSAIRPLAFLRNGQMTIVLRNTSGARSATVNNLTAGTYGVCRSVGGGIYQELGLQSVGGAGTLTVNVPGNSVLTVYPHPGSNQPPTVTDWHAGSDYLTLPASSTNLTASATDPETDPLTYAWSVAAQPPGPSVILSTPNAAQTQATGLAAAGDYTFTVAVSDPTHTVNREVRLTVFTANQPPVSMDVHNRIPLTVTLPASATTLRGGGWDLEGDSMSFQWSVVSQPAGASVNLATPTQGSCNASNMTVPGDYIFRFAVSDPTHTVSEDLTVTVYPVNPSAPVITSAGASPSLLQLPDSRTSLTAVTNDPDGEWISHWWTVKSKPAGTQPVFSRQGGPNTTVSGLTTDGTYVFTLIVVDRTRYTTRDVTVTVEPGNLEVRQFRAYD